MYRLRVERDHYNDGWSTGLMRRAALEVGRRAVEAGKLTTPELVAPVLVTILVWAVRA